MNNPQEMEGYGEPEPLLRGLLDPAFWFGAGVTLLVVLCILLLLRRAWGNYNPFE